MRVLLCSISLFFVFTQIGHTQKVSATIDRPQVLIGEPITYTLRVEMEESKRIQYKAFLKTIPAKRYSNNASIGTEEKTDIEINGEFYDTLLQRNKQFVWLGKYTITPWDSGSFVLPEHQIIIGDSTFYFSEVRLHCDLIATKKNIDLYDIKEIFADVPPKQGFFDKLLHHSWWLLPLIVLFVLVIVQLKRYKKATQPAEKEKEITLKEKTILAIESLEKRKLWEQNKLKQLYIELSYIMRSYLSSRYELNLLEKTTLESRILLREQGLHSETIQGIIDILQQSDMVKFAKSTPDEMTILKVSIKAKQIVAETSPIEFENV